jgi:protein-tyrosine phosphatase
MSIMPMSSNACKLPFPRSYWVSPGKFLAGYYPGDRRNKAMEQKMKALLDCGIRSVINLMETDERDHEGFLFKDYEPVLKHLTDGGFPVECLRMPIRDLDVPTPDFMAQILDRIDHAIEKGLPVYVHCWGGRGRTGTVVGCWLIRHGIAETNTVIEKIRTLRQYDPKAHFPSPEMPEQVWMVTSWNKGQ